MRVHLRQCAHGGETSVTMHAPAAYRVRAGAVVVARRYERTIGTLDALDPASLMPHLMPQYGDGPRPQARGGGGPDGDRSALARRAGHVYVMAHGGRVREGARRVGDLSRDHCRLSNRGRCLSCHSPPHNNTISGPTSTYGVRGYGIRAQRSSVGRAVLCCDCAHASTRQSRRTRRWDKLPGTNYLGLITWD